ncbi:MAG: DEAD/DEAH box helicase [Bacteroidetes bacterium]|nr:DEAD/DEAH box helicase [Bacteroidota bacterium]
MKFEDYRIDERIKANLNGLGFRKPTDIQYKSIPPILQRQDVLAIAQTGTGKTAAFAIPVIHSLISKPLTGLSCLIMVPTRELSEQIDKVFKEISAGTGLKSLALYGGVEQDKQIEKLKKGIHILITTPGRMFDLHHQGFIDFSGIRYLILDEADRMLDLGFIKDIRDVMKRLPAKKQTLFFSATINEKIKKLAYSVVNNPIRIQISPKNPVAKMVDHSVLFLNHDDKRFFLERIVRENPEKKIMVFTRTKVRADRVVNAMARVEIEAVAIHSGIPQNDRIKILDDFRSGQTKMLISTDVAARGIDIPEVDLVVNYDLPDQADQYVHRVGRTGRSNRKGVAISFCGEEENELLADIEKYLGEEITIHQISASTYEETLDYSRDADADWKTLIDDSLNPPKKKKKKRK